MATISEQIAELYIGYYNRAPDPEGLNYWIARVNAGVSLADIANSFATSPEAISTYPFFAFPNLASASDFLTSVYQNLFGRAPDADGLAYYSAKLSSGATPVGQIIAEILGNAQTNTGSPDQAYLANKVTVGLNWATTAANTQGYTYNDATASSAHSIVAGVDATAASVTAAEAATATFFATAGSAGTVYNLPANVTTLTADSGNNLINGVIDQRPGNDHSTFLTGDKIDGGAGNDTLRIVVNYSNSTVHADIVNVEHIEVRDFDGADIDLTTSSGIQTIAQTAGTSVTDFYGLKNLVDLSVSNTTGGIDLNYDPSVVSGASDVQKVSVSDANAYVYVNGIETFNVTSTGTGAAGNYLDLESDNSLATIKVSGGANITFDSFNSSVKTFDASAATGNVTAGFYGLAVAATGGSGNDTFWFHNGLTSADVVNGGGGRDTVIIQGGDFTGAAPAGLLNNLVSIESLHFNDAGTYLNGATFTNAGVSEIVFGTVGNDFDIVYNASSTIKYVVAHDEGNFGAQGVGLADFQLTGSNTTLNFELRGYDDNLSLLHSGYSSHVNVLEVDLSGTAPAGSVATVNLVSSGDVQTSQYNEINDLVATAGSKIIVTGDSNLEIDHLANSGSIDASALNGKLIVGASTFSAYDGVNPASYVSGQDTITFGKLGGQVNLGQLSSGVADTHGVLQVDTVNGFHAGANGDILDWTAGGSSGYTAIASATQALINALSGPAATLLSAANLATQDASSGWTAFTFNGTTYALHDTAGGVHNYDQAHDSLVALTGVNVSSLTSANFIG